MPAPGGALAICLVPFLPGGEAGAAWKQMWGPGAPGCWNALVPGLSCIHSGSGTAGAKQLGRADWDLLVNP